MAFTLPAAAVLSYGTRMGPLGLIFRDLDRRLQERIMAALHAAFEPYASGDAVRFTAPCWMASARLGASPMWQT